MVLVVAWLLAGAVFGQEAATFSKEQLDQILAPAALAEEKKPNSRRQQ